MALAAVEAATAIVTEFGDDPEALAALGVGWLYDRVGPSVLYAVPVLVAAVPPLALSGGLATALVGIAVWGLAFGLQD